MHGGRVAYTTDVEKIRLTRVCCVGKGQSIEFLAAAWAQGRAVQCCGPLFLFHVIKVNVSVS